MKLYVRRQLFGLSFLLIIVVLLFNLAQEQVDFQKEWSDFIIYDVGFGDFKPNQTALKILDQILVKGRAPKTNYSRQQFSPNWGKINNCDLRNLILQRDLTDLELAEDNCRVISGVLDDNYSGERIYFKRGAGTSNQVQIDHIVAVSDAWQKGAQSWSASKKYRFYNDPLNLIAVKASQNQQKSDSDAASWLPKNKRFRCQYITRQIEVKHKYDLWVTPAEKQMMSKQLKLCFSGADS